ncbi:4Fe-4S dicluster domain-containing protein [Chloroflexota bacterium]
MTEKEAKEGEAAARLPKAIGHISFNPERCSGCMTCMAVCSLYHEGAVCPDLSRIQVIAPYLKIFEVNGYTCKQCDYPECLYACPQDAIYVDEKTGARVIKEENCTGCKLCIKACPLYPNTPIRYNTERNVVSKCDLCDGNPQCVKFCPKSVDITPSLYRKQDHVLKFVKTGSK